jgi:hypothetical protein
MPPAKTFHSIFFLSLLSFFISLPIFLKAEDSAEINALCAKQAQLASVRYDELTQETIPELDGQDHIYKSWSRVWQKGPYKKIESHMTNEKGVELINIAIIRPDGSYLYSSSDKTWRSAPKEAPICVWASLIGFEGQNQSPIKKIIGTEVIDGKTCKVMQLSLEYGKSTRVSKQWVWEDKGLALKGEHSNLVDGKRVTLRISDYKNISFDKIPDREFKTPKVKE